MSYERILLEKANNVTTLTLNRPEKYNAMDVVFLREFKQCIEELSGDDETRAIIITGAGRSFCPGLDVVAVAQASADPAGSGMGRMTLDQPFGMAQVVPDSLHACRKPTIAAINGATAGLGMALACHCDYRIASEEAAFAAAFIRLGLATELGLSYILPRIVSLPVALEFLSLGERKDARWAERVGLVREVVPSARLMEAAQSLAGKLVKMPPLSLQVLKQLLHEGLTADYHMQIRSEGQATAMLSQTEDCREGVRSFLEKRPPVFKGR